MAGLNNWADSVNLLPGFAVEAFDSMFFNNFDAFSLALGDFGSGGAADQLILSDGIGILLSGAVSVGDSLSLADGFGSNLLSENTFGDSMNMSDLLGLQMNIGLIFTDTLTMSDNFTNSAATLLTISVSDTLNNWLDAVTMQASTNESVWLRQYLNDVVN